MSLPWGLVTLGDPELVAPVSLTSARSFGLGDDDDAAVLTPCKSARLLRLSSGGPIGCEVNLGELALGGGPLLLTLAPIGARGEPAACAAGTVVPLPLLLATHAALT